MQGKRTRSRKNKADFKEGRKVLSGKSYDRGRMDRVSNAGSEKVRGKMEMRQQTAFDRCRNK